MLPPFPVLMGGGIPRWALGADIATDYQIGRNYAPLSGLFPPGVDTHGETINANTPSGVYQPFAANIPVVTGLGLQTVPPRTNLFLNSFAPVTQSVTVVNATVYTVSITGTGSVTLTGAGTGVVTAGSSVTFTAGSTSLTCTVSGSPSTCNVEAGAFATPPIQTTGTSVTVNGNRQVISGLGTKLTTGVVGFVQWDVLESGSNFVNQLRFFDNATSTNRASLFFATNRLTWDIRDNNVAQATIDVGVFPTGIGTVAFVATANYFNGRIVGQALPAADTSGTWAAMDSLAFGGVGSNSNSNTYMRTRKIAVDFLTPSDDPATKFSEWFSKAQVASLN